MPLKLIHDLKNRVLQLLARELPGATGFRLTLHRCRGVRVGKNVCIGYDTIIETAHPELVTIKDGATVGIRCTILAHFWDFRSEVVIEEDAFVGPGAIILPNVIVGRGAVVSAGSVVVNSVPAGLMVQGNPAKPVARVGVPPKDGVPYKDFICSLKPLRSQGNSAELSDQRADVALSRG